MVWPSRLLMQIFFLLFWFCDYSTIRINLLPNAGIFMKRVCFNLCGTFWTYMYVFYFKQFSLHIFATTHLRSDDTGLFSAVNSWPFSRMSDFIHFISPLHTECTSHFKDIHCSILASLYQFIKHSFTAIHCL